MVEEQGKTGSLRIKKIKKPISGINTDDNSEATQKTPETTPDKTLESQIRTSKHFESDLTDITPEEFNAQAKELGIAIYYELAQAAEKRLQDVGFDVKKLPGQTVTLLESTNKVVEAIKSNRDGKPSNSLDALVDAPATNTTPGSNVTQEMYLELRANYDKRDNAVKHLLAKVANLEAQLTEAQTKPEVSVSQEEYNKLKINHDAALKAYEIAHNRVEELEAELKLNEDNYSKIQAKTMKLVSDNDNLRLDISAYETKIEDLESQLKSAAPSEKAADEQRTDLLNELKAAKEQLKAYEAKFDKLNSDNEHYKTELADAYDGISNLEDTVAGLENRLHEHNVATAGGTIQAVETETVVEGQEFSGAYSDAPIRPSYELHPEFGLVSISEKGMRFQPDTKGYIFDVDKRQRGWVGEGYVMFLGKHEENLHDYIYGKPKSESDDTEDLPTDSEE
jgi:chromosome segregation ATPase